jgi:flagellar basal-body rod modification protein FlgD
LAGGRHGTALAPSRADNTVPRGAGKERLMAVSGVGSTSTSHNGTTSAQDASALSQNMDTFLTLLTTQLKNQDPLAPQDSTQWVTQLVQFSSVEQQIHQRESLEQMLNLQLAWQSANAVGYIGKTVEASGDKTYLTDGNASIRYSLDEDAGQATVTIKDANGKTVREINVPTTKGAHEVSWNGKDKDGVALDDGFYTVSVKATKGQDTPVTATTTFSGVVDSVENANGQVLLHVGNAKLPIGDITLVKDTPPASTASN